MVKFRAERDGKAVFGLGLVGENVKLLKEGRPILVKLAEMGGPDVEVVVFFGRDMDELMELLGTRCDAETTVHVVPKVFEQLH